MLCIMAAMDQKDSTLRALVVIPRSGLCKAGFTGDPAPRAVFISFLSSGPDARHPGRYGPERQTVTWRDYGRHGAHGPDCIKLRKFRSCSSSRSSTFPSWRRGRFPRSCRTTEFPQWRVDSVVDVPVCRSCRFFVVVCVKTVEIPQCCSSSSLSWRRCRFPWSVYHRDSPVAVH